MTRAADVAGQLHLHPRVEYQDLAPAETRARLLAEVPALVPFPGKKYAGVLPILDWDHRLPSRQLVLRLYAYYAPEHLRAGRERMAERYEQIRQEDRFPEFDVPDFAELEGDEDYEFELGLDGTVQAARLVSPWRREVGDGHARLAVVVVKKSREFAALRKAMERAAELGEPEAVQWTAPCESGHRRWTVDVWYLLALDGAQGRGRSFLVDVEDKTVISTRDFLVRLS